jgi:TPR repeat protein
MKPLWRIAVPISCVALICGAAITWHFVQVRVTRQKLAEDAKACRVRAEQGDAKSQYDLGHMYLHGEGLPQDYGEALRWYDKAADQGEARAQYAIGYMHNHGEGVPQDSAEARRWYGKAADQGEARAQYAIGYMHYQGEGVPQDYAEALRWYRKAADQGEARAQYAIGFMYSQGKGVPQDYTEAVGWYRKAADQGYARAQYSLGYMYSQGKGVPQSYAEAAGWYRESAKQGDEYAQRALDSMKIGLTAQSKISLSVVFLASTLLLIMSRGSIRNGQQRRTTLSGILGLSWVGLDVYGYSHFSILQSLSAVNAFYFGKGLLSGICIAMLVSLVWRQGVKTVLGTCGILFIGFNIYAITHYDLGFLVSRPRTFYSTNGLFIGMALLSGILLWLEREKTTGGQNGNDGVASGTVVGNGTEPLRT